MENKISGQCCMLKRPYILVIIIFFGLFSNSLLGQSLSDMEELKELVKEQQKTTMSEVLESEQPKDAGATLTKVNIPEKESTSNHFGYSFFRSSRSIELLNNLPVPEDYILGPGDEVVITLWGETELVTTHEISRSNTINVPRVGELNLSGKSLKEAEAYVKGQLQQVYATLKGAHPRTYMSISMGKLKSLNVRFVGEVETPGLYPVHPFSTVTTGLMQAGGVDTTGSLRAIQVIRNGEIVTEVDLYAFLLEGKTDGDIRLQDQDVVFVPIRKSDIAISGEIRRPGIYEAIPEESLGDLLQYAGGPRATARSPIEIQRISLLANRINEDQAREVLYVSNDSIYNFGLMDGDSVQVFSALPAQQEIYIRGQVKKPGVYGYRESMRLMQALKLAGGLEDPSFLPTVYMERGEILRRNPNGDYAEVIPFNISGLLAGEEKDNILLENQDVIIIRKSEYFDRVESVTVHGEVKTPGVYSILQNGETLGNIIKRAGGYSERAFIDGLIMFRDSVRVISAADDFPVLEGDEITIPRKPGTVRVMGEVYNPGLIHFKKRLSLDDYIENAGGLTNNANKRNISVISPNGDVKIKGWLGSPKVVEGATILVHRKPQSDPLDITTFLRDVASITASLATIFFVISSK